MKVYYKFYQLRPKRNLNRVEQQASHQGVHLKIEQRRDQSFADFFSHPALGDIHLDEFLEKFKFQENEISQKTFYFLQNDAKLRFDSLAQLTPFKNHSLWHSSSDLKASVYKYKLLAQDDFTFVKLLQQNKLVRLDANGLFTGNEYQSFLKKIDPTLLAAIEYIEDPFIGNWQISSPVKIASDFIDNPDHAIKIHKPNREFLSPSLKPHIFSSYMGSQLGQWHSYCEMLAYADRSLYHGVHIDNFYEDDIFLQADQDCFIPQKIKVKRLYDELASAQWKVLCSI